MSEWRGPSDSWPTHRYPEAQRALGEAQHAGWWLKSAGDSAHGYGVLYCRRTSGPEFCKFPVFTTGGSDSEETAHRIREKIAKCHHGDRDEDPSSGAEPASAEILRGAQFHMDRAGRLLTATEFLATQHVLQARAAALLDEAASAAQDAESLLAQAVQADEDAAAAAEDARREADAVGMASRPWPPEDPRARLIDPAETDIDTANAMLRGSTGAEARTAMERLSALQDRVERCRHHLSSNTSE